MPKSAKPSEIRSTLPLITGSSCRHYLSWYNRSFQLSIRYNFVLCHYLHVCFSLLRTPYGFLYWLWCMRMWEHRINFTPFASLLYIEIARRSLLLSLCIALQIQGILRDAIEKKQISSSHSSQPSWLPSKSFSSYILPLSFTRL